MDEKMDMTMNTFSMMDPDHRSGVMVDGALNIKADGALFKVLVPFRITVLDDADRALQALAERMRAIQALEAQAEAEIERIAEEKIAQAKPIHEEILELEAELTHYLETEKRSLFIDCDCKSRNLNYGTIGFRESTKIKTCKKTLELIKSLGFTEAIKTKETLDKEAMKDWADDKLRQVEAKRNITDTPYYETKEFSIKEL